MTQIEPTLNKQLTQEDVLKELNPAEQEQAKLAFQRGETPEEVKAFFDSL